MSEKIIRNSVRCLRCDTEIVSEHRHDVRSCKCGDVAVDGGQEYKRRVYKKGAKWIDTSIVENDDETSALARAVKNWGPFVDDPNSPLLDMGSGKAWDDAVHTHKAERDQRGVGAMMPDIEICLRQERQQWSALLHHDDGTPDFFDDLVRRTALVVPPDRAFWPRWNANSAFTPSCWLGVEQSYYALSPELDDEWQMYAERWRRLLELNPRMMIADKLGDVSETHDSSSFPGGREHVIRNWVRAGMPDPRPFVDRNGVDTPTWRAEFMAAAEAAGKGWVFYADGPDVVFEWRQDDD